MYRSVMLYALQSISYSMGTEGKGFAAQEELNRNLAISQTLQELCRSLQIENAELSRRLEGKIAKEQLASKQSEEMQQAISNITAR